MISSGVQQRDSAIHIHVFILPQTSLPSRLPDNIEQSSPCCTVGLCWLSILNIAEHHILKNVQREVNEEFKVWSIGHKK